MKSGHNHRIMYNFFLLLFQLSAFPKGTWTNFTPYACLKVFLDETDAKFCQSNKNTTNKCLLKTHVLYIFCLKHLCIKHGYQPETFGFIDKIVSQSHFKYTVNLTFQYIQSRFVAMIHQTNFATEVAVVL